MSQKEMFQFRPIPIEYKGTIEFMTWHIEARDHLGKSTLNYSAVSACQDNFELYDYHKTSEVKDNQTGDFVESLAGTTKTDKSLTKTQQEPGPCFFDEPKKPRFTRDDSPDEGNCVLCIFGCTERGESVTAYVPYLPYLYVEIPIPWMIDKECQQFIKYLSQSTHIHEKQIKYEIQFCKHLYGWIPDDQDMTRVKKFKYLKIQFPTVRSYKSASSCIRYIKPNDYIRRKLSVNSSFKFQVWESDVEITTKFFDATKTQATSWISVSNFKYLREKRSHDQIEIEIPDLSKISHIGGKETIPPLQIVSTDIECWSSTGSFPDATNVRDYVITFGNCIQTFGRGTEECKYVIFTLGPCDPLEKLNLKKEELRNPENFLVISCETEYELLCRWRDFIVVHVNADIITGYNLLKFDWPYVDTRIKTIASVMSRFYYLGKLISDYVPLTDVNFSSKAFGTKESKNFKMTGRLIYDLYDHFKRLPEKFSNYTLDFMSEHFLKMNKVDLDKKKMFNLWEKGGPLGNAEIVWYCAKDCYLPIKLVDHLSIILNHMEMSRHTSTIIDRIVNGGQQIKIFNKIFIHCHRHGYILTKSLEKPQDVDYEGATVIEPKPGFYPMILTLDYSSLYPNCIRSNNFSYDTLILDTSFIQKFNMKLGEDYVGCRIDDKTEYFFVTEKLHIGLIPQILTESLNYREQVKKEMKLAKMAGDENRAKMLNGKQLAIKVTANSAYGNFGTGTRGKLPCAAIAACVTAVGRNALFTTQKMVEEKFKEQGAEVIYGDSVSGDTPILLKLADGTCAFKRIDQIYQFSDTCPDKLLLDLKEDIQVWSDNGWTKIKRIMRHKSDKKMFRIATPRGIVDVTQDHSLLSKDGIPLRPKDLKKGNELLHKEFPEINNTLTKLSDSDALNLGTLFNAGRLDQVPNIILNSGKSTQSLFWSECKQLNNICRSKIGLASLTYLVHCFNHKFWYKVNKQGTSMICLGDYKNHKVHNVTQIIDLGVTNDYVYDLETENHHFAAGIGNLVVHNTDSVMVKLNNVPTEDHDAEKWFKYGYEMAKMATQHFGKTMSLEMEKLWQPYLLLKKKRYCGVKRESLKSKGEIAYSGIELKKSDSTEFLKKTYKEMLNALFEEKSVIRCIQVLKERLNILQEGKVKYEDFVLSKNLKPESQYKNKNTTQLIVAQKMKKRNPTDYPKSGDKVRFVVIQDPDPKKLICDKAEDLQYAKEHNLPLDLEYYLENTLINPITQLMDAFHSNPQKLFEDTRRILLNKRTKQNTLQNFGVTIRASTSSNLLPDDNDDNKKIMRDLKMTKLDSTATKNVQVVSRSVNKKKTKTAITVNNQALLNMISTKK